MLKTRIVTAVILFAAFLCALFFFPSWGWVGIMALVAAAACWEWGALMGQPGSRRLVFGALMFSACAGIAVAFPSAVGIEGHTSDSAWQVGRWVYFPAGVFWLFVVPLWLRHRWTLQHCLVGGVTGVLVILPTWLALVQLRQLGVGQLLAIMAVVWLADVAAYFSGRAFGRHKLALTISPGKTWEGAIGGGLAVILYGFLFSSRLPQALSESSLLLLLVLVVLTAISIVGDLFESLLKRQAGLKDSSNLLPGHGGVLDRIDSLTSTLPLVALVWFGFNA